MKLLVLTSRFPFPLEKGDKLRIFYQIRELAKYHELVLAAVTEGPVPYSDYQIVKEFCSSIHLFPKSKFTLAKNLLKAVFTGLPFQVAWFFDEKIKQKLLKIVEQEKPDHAYCQLIRTAPYLMDVAIPKTLDYMDNYSRWTKKLLGNQPYPWMKWVLQWEVRKVTKFERMVFEKFDSHTIISEQDRDAMPIGENLKIHCIQNGVDTSFFRPLPEIEQRYDVAFVGNLSYVNNVEAAKFIAKSVVPKVLEKLPGCKFLIAGASPVSEVQRLENEHITIQGWLDDIRHAYAWSKVFIAPIFLAVGQQNKILEAMSMGVPCVTTPQVNNAIGAKPGESILLADSAEEFAERIAFLLKNDLKRKQMASYAIDLVRENFSWESAVSDLVKILEEHHPNK